MSNVCVITHNNVRVCTYVYVCTCPQRCTKHASSQREEPSRKIILTRSHIRATADGYESIKISHREPRVGRGNISNIRRADPSPAPHPFSITLAGLLASYISFPRLSSLPAALPLIRTFIISARETFFIDCPGTNLSDTGCKLFLPFTLQERFSFSSFLLLSLLRVYRCPCPFFPSPAHVSTSFSPICRVGMNT